MATTTASSTDATAGTKRKQPPSSVSSFTKPSKFKKQSVYVRFKNILLEHVDKENVSNPSQYAKEEFNKVKHMKVFCGDESGADSEVATLYGFKEQAETSEKQDLEAHEAKIRADAIQFNAQATEFCNSLKESSSIEELKKGVETMNAALELWSKEAWPLDIAKDYKGPLQEVKKKLLEEENVQEDKELVAFLQNADAEMLLKHATAYREALAAQAELAKIQAANARLEEDKKRQHEAAIAAASSIPGEIGKALQKQMVYFQGLKHTRKLITYSRGGATKEVFAAAFHVPITTKKVVKTASDLDIYGKALRYGAYIECGDVTITFNGDTIQAKAHYYMDK